MAVALPTAGTVPTVALRSPAAADLLAPTSAAAGALDALPDAFPALLLGLQEPPTDALPALPSVSVAGDVSELIPTAPTQPAVRIAVATMAQPMALSLSDNMREAAPPTLASVREDTRLHEPILFSPDDSDPIVALAAPARRQIETPEAAPPPTQAPSAEAAPVATEETAPIAISEPDRTPRVADDTPAPPAAPTTPAPAPTIAPETSAPAPPAERASTPVPAADVAAVPTPSRRPATPLARGKASARGPETSPNDGTSVAIASLPQPSASEDRTTPAALPVAATPPPIIEPPAPPTTAPTPQHITAAGATPAVRPAEAESLALPAVDTPVGPVAASPRNARVPVVEPREAPASPAPATPEAAPVADRKRDDALPASATTPVAPPVASASLASAIRTVEAAPLTPAIRTAEPVSLAPAVRAFAESTTAAPITGVASPALPSWAGARLTVTTEVAAAPAAAAPPVAADAPVLTHTPAPRPAAAIAPAMAPARDVAITTVAPPVVSLIVESVAHPTTTLSPRPTAGAVTTAPTPSGVATAAATTAPALMPTSAATVAPTRSLAEPNAPPVAMSGRAVAPATVFAASTARPLAGLPQPTPQREALAPDPMRPDVSVAPTHVEPSVALPRGARTSARTITRPESLPTDPRAAASAAPVATPDESDAVAPRASAAAVASVARATDDQPEPVTHLRLELAPPLLGEVVVELRHDSGTVTAHAIVSQPATQDVLRQVQAQVQQMLQSQGLQTGGFDVSTRDGGHHRGAMPEPPPAPARTPPTDVAATPAPPRPAPGSSRRADASVRVVDLYA